MCPSFKQLIPLTLVITAQLLLAGCVNSAQLSTQRVSLANSTQSSLSAEFSAPAPAETPNPTPPPITVPTEATAAPVPPSPKNNKGSLVEKFLNGDLPLEEELFIDSLGKNHIPLGHAEVNERTDVLEKRVRVQVYLLDAENVGTSSVILVGTIDPRTNERAVVPVLIGDQSTLYLNRVYWWVDPRQKPYFSDKDDVRPELKNAAELVDLIKAGELGQAARISFSLETFEDQMRAKGAPEQIITEYVDFFFPHIEANNRVISEPASLQSDIGVTGDLSNLSESQLAKLPRTFGVIKVWGGSTSLASNNFGTSTPEPTREPTLVSTPTSEASPTTALTAAPAIPSNPGNEALIGPDGKLKPTIPLKFLGLAEHGPIWGKMPLNPDGTVIMGVVTPFEPVFGIVNGAFSAVVDKPAFEENRHTYIGLVIQDQDGKIAHLKLRIDEFTGKNKQGNPLTGYSDAIGGVWTPKPSLSPVFKRTDNIWAVELLAVKDSINFGDQIVITFGDVRAAGAVPNLTDTQIEQMIQSGKEFGEQNNLLINGQIGFSDGMEIGTVLGVIDTSPHPTAPPTETPVAPGNQPSPQAGETDYSKMSQEQLKTIADNSVRMLQSHPERGPLPLTARVDVARLPGFPNYFVGAIVLEGAQTIQVTVPGLPVIDPEGATYTFDATAIPILLENSSGQYIVTHILIPRDNIVNYKMVVDHTEPTDESGSTKVMVDELLDILAPNVQHRFDIPTVMDQATIETVKNVKDNPDTPINEFEGAKTRRALVLAFGERTQRFFEDFEAGKLKEASEVPWIGPPIVVRVNTP